MAAQAEASAALSKQPSTLHISTAAVVVWVAHAGGHAADQAEAFAIYYSLLFLNPVAYNTRNLSQVQVGHAADQAEVAAALRQEATAAAPSANLFTPVSLDARFRVHAHCGHFL